MIAIFKSKHAEVLNIISKTLTIALCVVLCGLIFFYKVSNEIEKTNIIYNFVDLKTQYKNYIVSNKYIQYNNTEYYIFEVTNPISNKTDKIKVKNYLYTNVYFVGDTIK